MFEPVHAPPDFAGNGIANPIGQTGPGATMPCPSGAPEAADAVELPSPKFLRNHKFARQHRR